MLDDIQGLFIGALVLSIGLAFLKSSELLIGGTAGIAFLLHYSLDWNFGLTLFFINTPFYLLGIKRKGWAFTLKTLLSVLLVGVFTELIPLVLNIDFINPVFGAIGGGLLLGTGMLIIFRHNASLGGFNILVLIIQENYGISAGKVQMVLDALIVMAGLWLVPMPLFLASILAVVLLNFVIGVNRKPNRYAGF